MCVMWILIKLSTHTSPFNVGCKSVPWALSTQSLNGTSTFCGSIMHVDLGRGAFKTGYLSMVQLKQLV